MNIWNEHVNKLFINDYGVNSVLDFLNSIIQNSDVSSYLMKEIYGYNANSDGQHRKEIFIPISTALVIGHAPETQLLIYGQTSRYYEQITTIS